VTVGAARDRFLLTPAFIGEELDGLRRVAAKDWEVNALGDAPTRRERMGALHEAIASFVAGAVAQGDRPVSIAGDCCSAIGVLAGLQRAGVEPTLIWFDAHGDFNTWETTPSGFLGGMPLAMLVGRGDQTMPEDVGADPLAEARVILTDGRDLDPLEAPALAASEVVHEADTSALLHRVVPAGPLWVHVDVDVIDPAEAPAQNYPAPGGPAAATVAAVLSRFGRTGRVVAASMSSWNPQLDPEGTTAAVSMETFAALLDPPPGAVGGDFRL
jgi:arginase